jgi:hypothetical protein
VGSTLGRWEVTDQNVIAGRANQQMSLVRVSRAVLARIRARTQQMQEAEAAAAAAGASGSTGKAGAPDTAGTADDAAADAGVAAADAATAAAAAALPVADASAASSAALVPVKLNRAPVSVLSMWPPLPGQYITANMRLPGVPLRSGRWYFEITVLRPTMDLEIMLLVPGTAMGGVRLGAHRGDYSGSSAAQLFMSAPELPSKEDQERRKRRAAKRRAVRKAAGAGAGDGDEGLSSETDSTTSSSGSDSDSDSDSDASGSDGSGSGRDRKKAAKKKQRQAAAAAAASRGMGRGRGRGGRGGFFAQRDTRLAQPDAEECRHALLWDSAEATQRLTGGPAAAGGAAAASAAVAAAGRSATHRHAGKGGSRAAAAAAASSRAGTAGRGRSKGAEKAAAAPTADASATARPPKPAKWTSLIAAGPPRSHAKSSLWSSAGQASNEAPRDAFAAGDVLCVALDLDTGVLSATINGRWDEQRASVAAVITYPLARLQASPALLVVSAHNAAPQPSKRESSGMMHQQDTETPPLRRCIIIDNGEAEDAEVGPSAASGAGKGPSALRSPPANSLDLPPRLGVPTAGSAGVTAAVAAAVTQPEDAGVGGDEGEADEEEEEEDEREGAGTAAAGAGVGKSGKRRQRLHTGFAFPVPAGFLPLAAAYSPAARGVAVAATPAPASLPDTDTSATAATAAAPSHSIAATGGAAPAPAPAAAASAAAPVVAWAESAIPAVVGDARTLMHMHADFLNVASGEFSARYGALTSANRLAKEAADAAAAAAAAAAAEKKAEERARAKEKARAKRAREKAKARATAKEERKAKAKAAAAKKRAGAAAGDGSTDAPAAVASGDAGPVPRPDGLLHSDGEDSGSGGSSPRGEAVQAGAAGPGAASSVAFPLPFEAAAAFPPFQSGGAALRPAFAAAQASRGSGGGMPFSFGTTGPAAVGGTTGPAGPSSGHATPGLLQAAMPAAVAAPASAAAVAAPASAAEATAAAASAAGPSVAGPAPAAPSSTADAPSGATFASTGAAFAAQSPPAPVVGGGATESKGSELGDGDEEGSDDGEGSGAAAGPAGAALSAGAAFPHPSSVGAAPGGSHAGPAGSAGFAAFLASLRGPEPGVEPVGPAADLAAMRGARVAGTSRVMAVPSKKKRKGKGEEVEGEEEDEGGERGGGDKRKPGKSADKEGKKGGKRGKAGGSDDSDGGSSKSSADSAESSEDEDVKQERQLTAVKKAIVAAARKRYLMLPQLYEQLCSPPAIPGRLRLPGDPALLASATPRLHWLLFAPSLATAIGGNGLDTAVLPRALLPDPRCLLDTDVAELNGGMRGNVFGHPVVGVRRILFVAVRMLQSGLLVLGLANGLARLGDWRSCMAGTIKVTVHPAPHRKVGADLIQSVTGGVRIPGLPGKGEGGASSADDEDEEVSSVEAAAGTDLADKRVAKAVTDLKAADYKDPTVDLHVPELCSRLRPSSLRRPAPLASSPHASKGGAGVDESGGQGAGAAPAGPPLTTATGAGGGGRSRKSTEADGSIHVQDRIGLAAAVSSGGSVQGATGAATSSTLVSSVAFEPGPAVGELVVVEMLAVTVAVGPSAVEVLDRSMSGGGASGGKAGGVARFRDRAGRTLVGRPTRTLLQVNFLTSTSPRMACGSGELAVAGCTLAPEARAVLGGGSKLRVFYSVLIDPAAPGCSPDEWVPFLQRQGAVAVLGSAPSAPLAAAAGAGGGSANAAVAPAAGAGAAKA